MPNQLTLPVIAGNVPSGFCPSSYQEWINQFAALMSVTFPTTFTGITTSSTTPTDTSQAWLQLDSSGRPTRLYYFAQGAWLSQHPLVPGHTVIWFGALPNFAIYDGGDSNAISAISGPMWQQAEDASGNLIEAKFLLTVGSLPSGTAVTVGGTGGEEKHQLVAGEDVPHTHQITQNLYKVGMNAATNDAQSLIQNSTFQSPTAATLTTDSTGGTGTPAAALPHNNLPPYIGCYLLQRTGRLFYAV